MGVQEVQQFLSHLAVEGRVAASTRSQALSAIVFLYQQVLKAREAQLGTDHPETLTVRDHLGIALGSAGREADAPAGPSEDLEVDPHGLGAELHRRGTA